MNIKRTLNTNEAIYDLTELTSDEYITLVKAYEHYMYYIRHCPPDKADSMWQKMMELEKDIIKIV